MLACAMLLAGCSLRLETAPPVEPTPDAAEITREAAVVDVLAIRTEATELLATEPGDKISAQLERISDFSTFQLDALGGVYDSGLTSSTDDLATPEVSATPQTPTAESLVSDLADVYARSRAALATVPDPDAARLFASIAVSQLMSMRSLAAAARIDVPDVETSTTADSALPAGPADDEVTALIVGEDALGYSREVLASRLSDDARSTMYARAQTNRSRAAAWAGATSVRYSDDDPRQVLYTFPDGVPATTKALRKRIAVLSMEQAHRVSAALATVSADDRAAMADLLAATYLDAITDGAARQPLPGLPEFTD